MLCLPVLATQSYGEGEYLVTAWTNKPTNSRTILEARGCPIEIQQGICVPNQPTTTVDCKIVIACDSFFSRQHDFYFWSPVTAVGAPVDTQVG